MVSGGYDQQVVVELIARTEKLEKGMKRAEKTTKNVGKSIAKGFAVASAAIIGVTVVLNKLLKTFTDYGLKIDKAAKATGVAAEELQKWGYIAKQEHGNFQSIERAFLVISQRTVQASQGLATYTREFDTMGISIYNAQGQMKPANEIFIEMGDYLKNASNEAEALGHVTNLLGARQAKNLIPMLKLSNEELDRLGKEAEKLGLVLDTKTIKAVKKFDDQMTKAKEGFKGVIYQLGAALLPILNQLPQLITSVLPLFNKLMEIVGELLKRIIPFIQKLFDILLPIIEEILDAIMPILIQILDFALPILLKWLKMLLPILKLLTPILELIGALLTPILALLEPLMNLIITYLTPAIEFLADAIERVVEWLTKAIAKLMEFLGVKGLIEEEEEKALVASLRAELARKGAAARARGEPPPAPPGAPPVTEGEAVKKKARELGARSVWLLATLGYHLKVAEHGIGKLGESFSKLETVAADALQIIERRLRAWANITREIFAGPIRKAFKDAFGFLKLQLKETEGVFVSFLKNLWNSLMDFAAKVLASSLIQLAVKLVSMLVAPQSAVAGMGIGDIVLKALGFDNPWNDAMMQRQGRDIVRHLITGMQGALEPAFGGGGRSARTIVVRLPDPVGAFAEVYEETDPDSQQRFGRATRKAVGKDKEAD